MKASYKIDIEFNIEFDIDTLDELKSQTEMAEDIAHMICDEVTLVDGVCTYRVKKSVVEIA